MGKPWGNALELPHLVSGPTPPSGAVSLFVKSDGKVYVRQPAATEAAVIVEGDARLSDARTPIAHTHAAATDLTGTLADAQLPARLRAAQTNNTITDPNLAVETGFYYVNTGTGGPGPTDYFLSVVAYNTSYVTQFATDFRTSRSWRRQKSADVNAGAWSGWALIANQNEKAVFQLNTAGTDYSDAALEVRNDTNYPSIAFHKAGAYAPQIRAIGGQTFQVVDQPGTGYIDLKARDLYSSEVLVVKTNDSRLSDVREPNLNTVNTRTLAAELRSQGNVTGGGTVTYNSAAELRWTQRFIIIANGRGAYFSTNGFFDITIPADGTVITGVGGAANQTVVAGGIPIPIWTALYYILPIGSSNVSQPGNFRMVTYTGDLDVPPNWFMVAVRNSDNGGALRLCNGVTLTPGWTSTAANPYQQYSLTGHTHVATTDLTATGIKDATTFLRGDNTWAVPGGGAVAPLARTVYHPANETTLATNQTSPTELHANLAITFTAPTSGKVRVLLEAPGRTNNDSSPEIGRAHV